MRTKTWVLAWLLVGCATEEGVVADAEDAVMEEAEAPAEAPATE